MSIESILVSYINRFRTSPIPFEDQKAEAELLVRKNPEININPLGSNLSELTIFVIGDTHYHVTKRKSYDRTAVMPTAKLANSIRRQIYPVIKDWHKDVRPLLYNSALKKWPGTVTNLLNTHEVQKTHHVLEVHAGDIGDDSLNQKELAEAIQKTQTIMYEVGEIFKKSWGETTQISSIQLVGDHDADIRAWQFDHKTDQVRWFYDQLGLESQPASYLQDLKTAKDSKAVLMLDTNLLDSEWLRSIKAASVYALGKLCQATGFNNLTVEDLVKDTNIRSILLSKSDSSELASLFLATMTYIMVIGHAEIQQKLIEQAAKFKNLILIGHNPSELLPIAKKMSGKVTVIVGHRHFSKPADISINKPLQVLRLGAATTGAGGLEIKSHPVGYLLYISSNSDTGSDKIFPLIQ